MYWTVCLRGGVAGVDNDWEQAKLKARKMLENGNESPPSTARCVSPHLIFMDMVQKQLCYLSETRNNERPTSLSVQNLDP
jgi:hypothetical protein